MKGKGKNFSGGKDLIRRGDHRVELEIGVRHGCGKRATGRKKKHSREKMIKKHRRKKEIHQ